jgi:phosphatidylglycerophosphate synthase
VRAHRRAFDTAEIRILRDLFTLPNLLSLTRIALGAICMLAIVAGSQPALILAAVLIVAAALSDVADGTLARRCGTTSDLGRSLDATCDAIFHLAVFLAFLIKGWMPLWAVLCVYTCEISQPYLRSFARQFEAKPPPPAFEKIKGAAFWVSQLAVVLIVACAAPDFSVQGVAVLPTIFAVDAALALVVLVAFLRVLVQAKRRMAGIGR